MNLHEEINAIKSEHQVKRTVVAGTGTIVGGLVAKEVIDGMMFTSKAIDNHMEQKKSEMTEDEKKSADKRKKFYKAASKVGIFGLGLVAEAITTKGTKTLMDLVTKDERREIAKAIASRKKKS